MQTIKTEAEALKYLNDQPAKNGFMDGLGIDPSLLLRLRRENKVVMVLDWAGYIIALPGTTDFGMVIHGAAPKEANPLTP